MSVSRTDEGVVMKISEITRQSLSTLVADFLVCQFCGIVDRDHGRTKVGYPCPNCGEGSKSGLQYFGLPTHALINLMQESYHQKPTQSSRLPTSGNAHKLAVVIYFCTLGEVLLEHFLREVMEALRLPASVRNRILDDNLFAKERVEKVFPSLVGEKWNAVIKELSRNSELNYKKTVEFYLQVVKARNLFLHKGNKWTIPESLAEECMEEIWPLMNLYVKLHNRFIPAHYVGGKRKYRTYT